MHILLIFFSMVSVANTNFKNTYFILERSTFLLNSDLLDKNIASFLLIPYMLQRQPTT